MMQVYAHLKMNETGISARLSLIHISYCFRVSRRGFASAEAIPPA